MQRAGDEQKPVYKVMASACKFVPNFIIAKLAQDYLSPYIIGQVTPYLDPKAAAAIGKAIRSDYLGKTTMYVAPEITAQIATNMGMPHIYNVFEEMDKMGYYHRLGEITDFLAEKEILAILKKNPGTNLLYKTVQYMKNEKIIRVIAKNVSAEDKRIIHDKLEEAGSENRRYFEF